MGEGRARLRLFRRQEDRSGKREQRAKRRGPVPDTGTGLVSSIGKSQRKNKLSRNRARMGRDARERVACRYNKTIARRGYRLDDHNERRVEFLGRGEHVKGFQQA
jgi:hypothetical protein